MYFCIPVVGDSGVGKTALTNLICHGAGLLNPGNIYFIVDRLLSFSGPILSEK